MSSIVPIMRLRARRNKKSYTSTTGTNETTISGKLRLCHPFPRPIGTRLSTQLDRFAPKSSPPSSCLYPKVKPLSLCYAPKRLSWLCNCSFFGRWCVRSDGCPFFFFQRTEFRRYLGKPELSKGVEYGMSFLYWTLFTETDTSQLRYPWLSNKAAE